MLFMVVPGRYWLSLGPDVWSEHITIAKTCHPAPYLCVNNYGNHSSWSLDREVVRSGAGIHLARLINCMGTKSNAEQRGRVSRWIILGC